MEEYIRKLKRLSSNREGLRGFKKPLRRIKKILIAVAVLLILAVVALIILAIVALSWLFNRRDQVGQVVNPVASQLQTASGALALSTFIQNGEVNEQQLQQAFNAVPEALQQRWLEQFNTQLQQLGQQANISPEAIQSLTQTYNSLQALSNQGEN